MKYNQRKFIFSSRLARVMNLILQHSMYGKTESSCSYDFERAAPIIDKLGLHGHIYIGSRNFGTVPLNSENHVYDVHNIIIKRLNIRVTNNSSWKDYIGQKPFFFLKWHFEDCIFESYSSICAISFPWKGNFRLYKNNFICHIPFGSRTWLFNFEKDSRYLFHKNHFNNSDIQIFLTIDGERVDLNSISGTDNSASLDNLTLSGNREIGDLLLSCNARQYVFTGINQINRLDFYPNEQYISSKVNLGSREQIDPDFNHCLHHRGLFLSLKKLSIQAHDTKLTNSLDKHLDRVEYHLVKTQNISITDGLGNWVQYWQDRALYGWRRLSTDFYRSWLRPLFLLISGYVVLNALPLLFIDSFTFRDWSEFTLRAIHKIPFYTDSLRGILDARYEDIALWQRNLLRLTGIIQATWIGLCSFVLFKSIKR